jgi:hypothetical protein
MENRGFINYSKSHQKMVNYYLANENTDTEKLYQYLLLDIE